MEAYNDFENEFIEEEKIGIIIKYIKDNGKIIAGQGNNKYMKINRDGSVDKETLKGFYDDDYILSDGETVSGEIIKQRTLDSIKIEIDNIQESINENNQTIVSINNSLDALNDRKQEVQDKVIEIFGEENLFWMVFFIIIRVRFSKLQIQSSNLINIIFFDLSSIYIFVINILNALNIFTRKI